MRVELAAIGEIKNVSNIENIERRIEEIDKKTEIFMIKENESDEDLLLKAIKMYMTVVKSFWHIKLQKDINLIFQDMDIDFDMSE